jgi:predicted RNase H-like HicB family nuclease
MHYTIESEQEADGRWLAEVPELPGVLAYGTTQGQAQSKAEALALRVLAERLESHECQPQPIHIEFGTASAWANGLLPRPKRFSRHGCNQGPFLGPKTGKYRNLTKAREALGNASLDLTANSDRIPVSEERSGDFVDSLSSFHHNAGWSSPVAREAHNLEVAGSNPVPATFWSGSETDRPSGERKNPRPCLGFFRFYVIEHASNLLKACGRWQQTDHQADDNWVSSAKSAR